LSNRQQTGLNRSFAGRVLNVSSSEGGDDRKKQTNALALHDGRDRVGNVQLRQGKFVALDVEDRVVGKFATLHEAMNSIRNIKEK
jgi:hypothetical protein